MERGLQALNKSNNMKLWAERIRECRESGKTVLQWCSDNGVSRNTYYRWQRLVFEEYSGGDCFVEIRPEKENVPQAAAPVAAIRLHGAEAYFYAGADAALAEAICRGLQ